VSTELKQGDTLGGKFRIERLVGRGGMGVVMEATNVQLDQKVAIKLLARKADDPSVVERFMREAKAAARLKSEHVARVFDVGKDPTHGPFIVMEFLDGKTLAQLVSETGRVPLHRAVEYVIDACEGLAEAHARGIVHQDVKPGNLFVVTGDDGRPSVKVLDFGIATMRTKEPATRDSKSSAPRSQGTPAYLSPEQLRGHDVDHRADIWSLGCVLYELLCAERAFRSQRFTELVTQILETPPEPMPADLELPSAVTQVLDRCLQKNPEARYHSTGELALALLPFARRRAHSSVAKAVAHVKTGGLDPNLEMPSSMPPPPNVADSGPTDIALMPTLRPPPVPSFSDAPVEKKTSSAPGRVRLAPVLLFFAVALGGVAGALAIAFSTKDAKKPDEPTLGASAHESTVVAPPTSSSEEPAIVPPPILVGSDTVPIDPPQVTVPTNMRPRERRGDKPAAPPKPSASGRPTDEAEIRLTR
jgi:serine/threonine-protein kinase